ncbi:unnamed protein product [Allacma fusca]|uniref:Uncharacterized protein n=1 Tax=Allacma fusca TaxID=39272 RepID=A0A8J2PN25_9HEXA|nr:unnamed protein product [Allacma fusca]
MEIHKNDIQSDGMILTMPMSLLAKPETFNSPVPPQILFSLTKATKTLRVSNFEGAGATIHPSFHDD